MEVLRERWPLLILLLVGLLTFGAKTTILDVGAPYVTIDDDTMYEAGFLVWYGQAPPQRMYIESWVSGLSSIGTYVARTIASGEASTLGINVVTDAYRDFYVNPDPYVLTYRVFSFLVDLLTAVFVFLIGREVFRGRAEERWAPHLVAVLYMLSFNTVWCSIVARPDTPTTFLVAVGTWFYLRSRHGEHLPRLLFAAVFLGLGAGYKLHAAFAVIFAVLDLWRALGWKLAWRRMTALASLSLVFFAVGAGSILFDPLLYVKLRALNHRDDASPWIQWGEQFLAMLRGTGWLGVLAAVGGIVVTLRDGWRSRSPLHSVAFMAIGWLLLFASIRVLRAYWMLPALPLFYAMAVVAVGAVRPRSVRVAVPVVLAALMAWQFTGQVREFASVPYGELREWLAENVGGDEVVYVLGYEALGVAKSPMARGVESALLRDRLDVDPAESRGFTQDHVVLWEERARATRLRMLSGSIDDGLSYFSLHRAPVEDLRADVPLETIRFVVTHEFVDSGDDELAAKLSGPSFERVAQLIGYGGGGSGMRFEVFRRTGAAGAGQ